MEFLSGSIVKYEIITAQKGGYQLYPNPPPNPTKLISTA